MSEESPRGPVERIVVRNRESAMAIHRNYTCDLCREMLNTEPFADPSVRPIGLHWQSWPAGWTERPWRETERHICVTCLCSLQALPERCGQGYECDGGPKCGCDHK